MTYTHSCDSSPRYEDPAPVYPDRGFQTRVQAPSTANVLASSVAQRQT